MGREPRSKTSRRAAARKFMRRWGWPIAGVLVVAGVAAGIVLATVSRTRSQAGALSSPEPVDSSTLVIGPRTGELAPDFALRSLGGETVRLSELRGQVVILDFWASWCAPCKVTFPKLHELWRSVADRDVLLVGVSLDRTQADAEAYLIATGFGDMIALWESRSAALRVAERFAVSGIPRTLVIDRDGVVRYNGHPAGLSSKVLEEILDSPRSAASPPVH
jgi:thiol-disulfide isomerase/thioredoxin